MKTMSVELAGGIAREATTLAILWRIVRRDGVALGFTTHDRAIELDGLVYRAAPGLVPSAITAGDAGAHAQEVAGALTDDAITEADLAGGRYDGARIEAMLVDWEQLGAGTAELMTGRVGDVEMKDAAFTAELVSPLAELSASPIEMISPECRARLGDMRCRVDMARRERVAVVSAVAGAVVSVGGGGLAADAFRYGRVRVLTGAACGEERTIVGWSAAAVTLGEPVAGLAAGALLSVREGCDKRFATCRDRFGNAANFRGEPHVPGQDALNRYPGL